MIGIKSYGAYIPVYRLSNEVIARAWERRGRAGERAVANFDEDSLTMATESAINCLAGRASARVDGVYFASTTSPYREKQAASILGSALDLANPFRTADIGGSLRSGTIALRAAIDAVQAGSMRDVIVAASDCRLAEPGSDQEALLGDAAASLLVGDSDVAVEIEAFYTQSDDFLDTWRRSGDSYVLASDARFSHTFGYVRNMEEAGRALLEETDLQPADFAKAIFYSRDSRSHLAVAERLGFEAALVQDPLVNKIGQSGTAHALLMLVAALEEARPGDRMLFLSYGDGCDAFVLRAKQELAIIQGRCGFRECLQTKRNLQTYQKYLKFRGLLPETRRSEPFSSPVSYWREQNQYLRFHGVRCRSCGRIQYPVVRICRRCGAKDNFDEVKMPKRGEVLSFEADYYFPSPNTPTVMAEVDLEGGGRVLLPLTDCDHEAVHVGMPVELTIRRYHEGGSFINYYWKCRPLQGEVQDAKL